MCITLYPVSVFRTQDLFAILLIENATCIAIVLHHLPAGA